MRYALCTLRSSEHIDGNEARKVTWRFAQPTFKPSRAKSRDRPGGRRVDFLSNQAYKIPIMIA